MNRDPSARSIFFRAISFFFAAVFATAAAAATATWQIDPVHSSVTFSIRHMMISNVHGEFSKVTGTVVGDPKVPAEATIEAAIDLASINTHEPKRDADLKSPNFFDVAKYPAMTFKSKKIEQVASGKLKVTGDLSLHGVTKEVVLDVDGPTPEVKDPWGNIRVGATATTKISRKDFGMTYNAVLDSGGVVIGDEVAITLEVELIKKAAPAEGGKKASP